MMIYILKNNKAEFIEKQISRIKIVKNEICLLFCRGQKIYKSIIISLFMCRRVTIYTYINEYGVVFIKNTLCIIYFF